MWKGNQSKWLVVSVLLSIIMMACGGVSVVVTPNPTSVQPTATFTPIATLVPTMMPSPLPAGPAALPSPTPFLGTFTPYYVSTTVENGNLRTEPGTTFPVSRVMAKGTRLQVNGHAPGDEWIYVRTDSFVYGWVLGWLLEGWPNIGATPEIQPQNVQTITGTVVDLAGVPISGIGFAITQGSGPNAPRTDGMTDSRGRFYAYLPLSARGQWTVAFVSVARTSNTMDANGNCIGYCGTADPVSLAITLPYNGGDLRFTWK